MSDPLARCEAATNAIIALEDSGEIADISWFDVSPDEAGRPVIDIDSHELTAEALEKIAKALRDARDPGEEGGEPCGVCGSRYANHVCPR